MAAPERRSHNGFQTAIENLTTGLSDLVSQHMELIRTEVREEASSVGKNVAILASMGAFALLGYGLTLLGILFIVGWLAGTAALAFSTLGLGLLHLIVAGLAIRGALLRLQNNDDRLPNTTEELQRNREWIKEIREQSSPALPVETS